MDDRLADAYDIFVLTTPHTGGPDPQLLRFGIMQQDEAFVSLRENAEERFENLVEDLIQVERSGQGSADFQ